MLGSVCGGGGGNESFRELKDMCKEGSNETHVNSIESKSYSNKLLKKKSKRYAVKIRVEEAEYSAS